MAFQPMNSFLARHGLLIKNALVPTIHHSSIRQFLFSQENFNTIVFLSNESALLLKVLKGLARLLWLKAFRLVYENFRFEIWALLFLGLLWPQQPRRLDGKPQILMWILMWKKGKNLVYLYEKLSILSIGGARLIFMNSSKCPTKSLIKKWDVVLCLEILLLPAKYKDSRILNLNHDYCTHNQLPQYKVTVQSTWDV